MSEPVAATIYAAQLTNQKEGYPLWDPDPRSEPAVEIADVGYVKNGAWVRLFNASKPSEDMSNKFGVPCGYQPLQIGEIQERTPFPPNVPIQSESVLQLGAQANLSGGVFRQAGGGFSFECSREQGAVLLLGDDADRRDALRNVDFMKYFLTHYAAWLAFANDDRKRGILLSDLVFVTGCDKTSAWASAAFSGKSSQAGLSINGGQPGVLQGAVTLSWAWKNCASVATRSGPQRHAHTIARLLDAPPRGSLENDGDGDAVMSEERGDFVTSWSLPTRNQCVFLRGFKICDRKTGLTRVLSGRRKRTYDGFTHISNKRRRDDPGSGPPGPSRPGSGFSGSQDGASGSSHEPSGSQHQPSQGSGSRATGGSYDSESGGQSKESDQSASSGSSEADSLDSGLSDEDLELYLQLNIEKNPTPLDLLLDYILEMCTAKLALVHDDDLIAILQSIKFDEDFEAHIYRLAPTIMVDAETQVGMLANTYRLTRNAESPPVDLFVLGRNATATRPSSLPSSTPPQPSMSTGTQLQTPDGGPTSVAYGFGSFDDRQNDITPNVYFDSHQASDSSDAKFSKLPVDVSRARPLHNHLSLTSAAIDEWITILLVSSGMRQYKCNWPTCSDGPWNHKSFARVHVYGHFEMAGWPLYHDGSTPTLVKRDKRFASVSTAKRQRHTQAKVFDCDTCNKKFARKGYRDIHQRRCKGAKADARTVTRTSPKAEEKFWKPLEKPVDVPANSSLLSDSPPVPPGHLPIFPDIVERGPGEVGEPTGLNTPEASGRHAFNQLEDSGFPGVQSDSHLSGSF